MKDDHQIKIRLRCFFKVKRKSASGRSFHSFGADHVRVIISVPFSEDLKFTECKSDNGFNKLEI